MAGTQASSVLPVELIYHIIGYVLPVNRDEILPPSHTATKTLLALSTVCRATFPVATAHLWRHCLYIDSRPRLRLLLEGLRSRQARADVAKPSPHSLYLGPFTGEYLDLPTAQHVRDLFYEVRASLRRLVIDMPLRSLYPEDDTEGLRQTLREGFVTLTALEEFVTVRDELFLETVPASHRLADQEEEPAVWRLWAQLRRLALYNANVVHDSLLVHAAALPRLETIVLTRADGLSHGCLKSEFFQRGDPRRAVKVLLVNVADQQPPDLQRHRWATVDPRGLMRVIEYNVPTSFYGDEDPITLCQEWVKSAALKGTLWKWEGIEVEADPPATQGTDTL
ncbi:hypothetical protein VTK73DRAFT_9304 [Phialemonium thermophilum]|uniref:F-box domain-containing protein n=1 Tax=Phialemonium thermophilum TaxID=223376 RepID=A0ABR3XKD1_9PEZI